MGRVVKYICDSCGEEFETKYSPLGVHSLKLSAEWRDCYMDELGDRGFAMNRKIFCEKCSKKIINFLEKDIKIKSEKTFEPHY